MDTVNKKVKIRNEIIEEYGLLTTYSFSISLAGLKLLVAEGFVTLEESNNSAPTVEQFILIGNEINKKELTYHGYLVYSSPEICKVIVEGCEYVGEMSDVLINIFKKYFKEADEFSLNKYHFFCWYD